MQSVRRDERNQWIYTIKRRLLTGLELRESLYVPLVTYKARLRISNNKINTNSYAVSNYMFKVNIELVTSLENTLINNLILCGTNSKGEKQLETHFPQYDFCWSGLLKHHWESICLKRITNDMYVKQQKIEFSNCNYCF